MRSYRISMLGAVVYFTIYADRGVIQLYILAKLIAQLLTAIYIRI